MSLACVALAWAIVAGLNTHPTGAEAAEPFRDLNLIRPALATPAPHFELPRLPSGVMTMKDLRQRVVLVNFWATWCPPCREEMPSMERLYRRHKDRGFTIVAISIDHDSADRVAAFANALGLTFPIALDRKGHVASRYTVRALPSSFLIDRTGHIAAIALGPRNWDATAAHALVETVRTMNP